uniref:W2 domain-containing protein n=1 Tax=Monodelphis domestica TaxID=13616 RepID=A0A5F8G5J2_MONDO
MKTFAQVFNKLIRQYLEKGFQDEVKKQLLFLKGFSDSERNKLAILPQVPLANGTLNASILNSLYNENLVKEGISMVFAVKLFKSWINEKYINAVAASLQKVSMDNRLMELFSANKQSIEHFTKHFTETQTIGACKELQKELQQQMEEMKKYNILEQTTIGIKIVVLFYKANVLSEGPILKWYKDAYVAKGESVFLEQMKKIVEWLKNAEEESSSEAEGSN